jgi:hypothetical protein
MPSPNERCPTPLYNIVSHESMQQPFYAFTGKENIIERKKATCAAIVGPFDRIPYTYPT